MVQKCIYIPEANQLHESNTEGKVISPLYKAFFAVTGDRDMAVKAYALCFSDKFQSAHASKIKFDDNYFNPTYRTAEPTFNSVKNLPEIKELLGSKESQLEALNKTLKAGIHTMNSALDIMGSLKRDANLNKKYIVQLTAISSGENAGKVNVTIVENTRTARKQLRHFLEQQTYKDLLTGALATSGVHTKYVDKINSVEDPLGMYSTMAPERVLDNLLTLIQIKEGKTISEKDKTQTLSEESGHFITDVAANSKQDSVVHRIYNRLFTTLKTHPEIVSSFLTTKEIIDTTSEIGDAQIIEAMGKIIGNIMMAERGKASTAKLSRTIAPLASRLWNNVLSTLVESKKWLAYITNQDNLRLHSKDLTSNSELTEEERAKLYEEIKDRLPNFNKAYLKNAVNSYVHTLINEFFSNQIDADTLEEAKQVTLFNKSTLESTRRANAISNYMKGFLRQMENMGLTQEDKGLKQFRKKLYSDIQNRKNILIHNSALAADLDVNFIYESLLNLQSLASTINTVTLQTSLGESLIQAVKGLEIGDLVKEVDFQKAFNECQKCIQFIAAFQSVIAQVEFFKSTSPTVYNASSLPALMESISPLATQLCTDIRERSHSLFEALLTTMNNGNEYITINRRMRKVAGEQIGKIKGKSYYTSELDKATYTIKELLEEYNDKDMNWYGMWILQANRSSDIITQIFASFTDYCKSEQNRELSKIQLDLLQKMDNLRKINGNTDTEWMYEVDEEGNLTGNILSEVNWGAWEKARDARWQELKDAWRLNHKEELKSWTADEAAQSMLKDLIGDYNAWYIANCEPQNDPILGNKINNDIELDVKWVPKKSLYRNETWFRLTPQQQAFINDYLKLKKYLDSKIEPYRRGATVLCRAPQFRGNVVNRFRHTKEGNWFKSGKRILAEKINETFFEDCLDTDFGCETTYNNLEDCLDPNHYSLELNLRVPLFGINKLTNIRRVNEGPNAQIKTAAKYATLGLYRPGEVKSVDNTNALSTDIFYSTMMYASMATNFEAMNLVGAAAFSGMYTLQDRRINDVVESIKAQYGNTSNIYKRFAKYVQMNVFGKYSNKNIFSIRGKQFVWEKFVKTLSANTSLRLLSGKSNSAWVNTSTGFNQITKEAAVGEHFTRKEFIAANKVYWTGIAQTAKHGDLMHYTETYRNNKLYRFIQFMDAQNKNNQHYKEMETTIPLALRLQWGMHWYENGDHWMQVIPYIAKAMHTTLYKVEEGEEVTDKDLRTQHDIRGFKDRFVKDGNVWENFNEEGINNQNGVTDTTAGNPYIGDYYIKNADGTFERWNPVSQSRFKDACRGLSDDLHGVYNSNDQAASTQNAIIASMFTMKKYFLGYSNSLYLPPIWSFTHKEDITGSMQAFKTLLGWAFQEKRKNILIPLSIGALTPLIAGLASTTVFPSSLLGAAAASWYGVFGNILKHNTKWQKNLREEGFSKSQVCALQRLNCTVLRFLLHSTISRLIAKGLINPSFDDDNNPEDSVDEKIATRILGIEDYKQAVAALKSKKNAKDPGFLYTIIMKNYLQPFDSQETYLQNRKDQNAMYYLLANMYYFNSRLAWEQQVINPINILLDARQPWDELQTQWKEVIGFVSPTWVSGLVDTFQLLHSATEEFKAGNANILRDKKINDFKTLAAVCNIEIPEGTDLSTNTKADIFFMQNMDKIYNSDWFKYHNWWEIYGTFKFLHLKTSGNNFLNKAYKYSPGLWNDGYWTGDGFTATERYRMGRKG